MCDPAHSYGKLWSYARPGGGLLEQQGVQMILRGKSLATASVALVTASAIAIAPTVPEPSSPHVAAVRLAAATAPAWAESLAEQTGALEALVNLDLGRFLLPPSAAKVFPTPPEVPGPSPAPVNFEFEDAIINTYEAIEPWVQYGFEVATYAVGWIPWFGWLAPQIMIFYHWLEPVVHSLVVNSANWLWGPLPFFEGLGNIAEDSWYAFGNFLRMQWDFWLPPLPPLPGRALQAETQLLGAIESLAPADQPVTSPTTRPHPLQDILAALHRVLPAPHAVELKKGTLEAVGDLQEGVAEAVGDVQEGVAEAVGDLQEGVAEAVGDLQEGTLKAVGDLQEGAVDAVGDLQEKGRLLKKRYFQAKGDLQADVQRVAAPDNSGDDPQMQAELVGAPANSVETKANPSDGTPSLAGKKFGSARSTLKLFGKHKQPGKQKAAGQPSDKAVGASDGPAGASSDSTGSPNKPKIRFNGLKKRHASDS